MGVLSDKTILNEIKAGNIIIEPFNIKYLNPVSVDLTLAPTCKRYVGSTLDCRKDNPTEEFQIPETGYTLLPNNLYLYACNEIIGVKENICATIMGKSSLGRLGLDIHVCAGFADPGFVGSLVLEMRVVHPLVIYPNQKICQIKFERVEGEILESYDRKPGSKYMNQQGVTASRMHQNF